MATSDAAGRSRRYAKPIDEHRELILELRAHGMSYPAICTALRVFKGAVFTAEQVNYALGKWGEAPRRRKARV